MTRYLLEEIGQRHAAMQGGFGLLANVKHITVEEPFEVAPGVHFRPAQDDEALSLKQVLTFATIDGFFRHRNPYETRIQTEVISSDHTRTYIHDLPTEEHRYYVAEFTGTNLTLHRILEASVLTSCELEMGIDIQVNVAGCKFGFSLGSQQRILEEAKHDDECLLTLDLSNLEDLKRVFIRLQNHQDEGVGLLPALDQFKDLRAIPISSPLRFLGYMAILESLIAHQPKPSDPYESLRRQVKQKMLLLGRRSYLKPPYECFGQHCRKDKLWTTLYDYRSAVAHGSSVDFGRGEFRMLGSARKALEFIKASTIAVMRHALDEPELVSDLRKTSPCPNAGPSGQERIRAGQAVGRVTAPG